MSSFEQTWNTRGTDGFDMAEKILRCGDCRLCCQLPGLIVNHHDDDDSSLRTYTKNGRFIAKSRGSGACVYLKPHGCSVYDKRPKTCRNFTCEIFLEPRWDRFNSTTQTNTIEPLRAAARAMIGRHKRSIAHRFNAALKG